MYGKENAKPSKIGEHRTNHCQNIVCRNIFFRFVPKEVDKAINGVSVQSTSNQPGGKGIHSA